MQPHVRFDNLTVKRNSYSIKLSGHTSKMDGDLTYHQEIKHSWSNSLLQIMNNPRCY